MDKVKLMEVFDGLEEMFGEELLNDFGDLLVQMFTSGDLVRHISKKDDSSFSYKPYRHKFLTDGIINGLEYDNRKLKEENDTLTDLVLYWKNKVKKDDEFKL